MAGYIGSKSSVVLNAGATAAQGALADTAVQPNDNVTLGAVTATSFSGDGSGLTGLSGIPASTIIYVAQNTAPTGYLKANGAVVSRTTYADLFSAIGTTFGAGDGSTTFALPDLRGEFIRGWDDSRGVDSGRVFGSTQADELKSHAHRQRIGRGWTDNQRTIPGSAYFSDSSVTNTQFTDYTGGSETRPRNIALLACIKY